MHEHGQNSLPRLFFFFFFFFPFLTLFNGRGYCISSSLSDYTYDDPSKKESGKPENDDVRHLTYVKLGVALGMFAITAGACSLPVIVITCITRRVCTRRCSGSRSSASISPSYTSGAEELDGSSPTFLLDPQSTEPDEALLTQGSDSNRGDISQTHNRGVRPSFYEEDSHEGSSVSRDTHRLHWANSVSDASIIDVPGVDMLNEGAEIDRNVALSSVPTKTIRRRSSLRRIRQMKTWASRINCFAAGIFLTTGLMDLFPDVNDAMAVAMSALKINTHYPLSALFTLLGFFLVLTVEQGAHICHRRHRSRSSSNSTAPHNHQEYSGHSHDHGMIIEAGSGASDSQILLLLIALSVHSVFEGLAVGLQRSVSEVVTLFSALLLHKLIMAASIGFSLATACQQQVGGIARSQWMGAIFFALASPIGVLIGWALIAQRSSPALLMAIAILQGLACGTFFFVVFCEMLPHEFGENEVLDVKDRIGKIVSLVLGFGLIATYIAFGPE
ncbi:hypothetical protein Aperf_G00000061485 [Anoplocephala perfoliata]